MSDLTICDCGELMLLIRDNVDARGVRLLVWMCETCGGDDESYSGFVSVHRPKRR